jgi:hypothetical protein
VTLGRATYDAYDRVLDAFDAADYKTTTAYTPASGAPVTKTTVTNPLLQVSTSELEPAWGVPLAAVDANGKRAVGVVAVALVVVAMVVLVVAWLTGRLHVGWWGVLGLLSLAGWGGAGCGES